MYADINHRRTRSFACCDVCRFVRQFRRLVGAFSDASLLLFI